MKRIVTDTGKPGWHNKRLKKFIGKQFGRLTIVDWDHDVYYTESRVAYWRCKCCCGNEVIVAQSSLTAGLTKSCGCLRHDAAIESHTTHGMSYTRLYRVYKSMCNRCYNPNVKRFKDYGGRGITVCDEWLDKDTGFQAFYNWAIKTGYIEPPRDVKVNDITLDRKDVNGPYSPDNCRWIGMIEQQNNRRDNHIFHIKGERLTISQVYKKYNRSPSYISDRIHYGWCDDAIIYAILHPELGLRMKNGGYVDKDGFTVLIPRS